MNTSPNVSIRDTTNYMVPSSGNTHVVPISGVFSADPFTIDWRQFGIENFPFQPQGVFIDNTQGAGTLTVTIGPLGWTVTCPAGSQVQAQFPAPNGQSASIVGNGQADVIFADFPVLPSANAVTILGGSVAISGPNPLPVSPTVNSGGVPYQNTEVPVTLTNSMYNAAITGAALTSGNITPNANTFLRKLILSLSGNVTLGVAGLNVITATLNGIQIYKRSIYIPAAATNLAQYWEEVLDFAKLGLSAGAAGSLVVTVGTALATGVLEVNAWFG